MAGRIRFILGVHCHQPVGNFDHVFNHGLDVSYRPFLQTLARFPEVSAVLHYSGPLLEWISEHDPEFFSLVRELAGRGQVEISGGGHNEPVLTVIPRRDALGQIGQARRYLRRSFGVDVRGAWLTERIWEPHLPSLLADAGLEYVTVDDYHFLAAGWDPESLHGYYLAEDQGRTVAIFPISQSLRYLVPFREVDEVIRFFREQAERLPDGAVLTLADDGEKFGMWPGTHEWCFERGWLEKFFTALTDNSDWLETTTFSHALDTSPATGRIYLPAASYMEMGGWSLPAESGERFQKLQAGLEREGRLDEFFPFLRGSFWRNFLIKYPESGWMHGRMWQVSDLLASSLSPTAYNRSRPPEALACLWRAQNNCPYWHGIFGGLYLPHLRKAVYANLIRAEKLALRTTSAPELRRETLDIDRDGREEVVLANRLLSLTVKPDDGGTIAELDSLEAEFNITDTLARRPESYHYMMVEGGGDEPAHGDGGDDGHASIHERTFEDKIDPRDMIYDRWSRRMMRDRFFALPPDSGDSVSRGEPEELGDFADGEWIVHLGAARGSRRSVTLSRSGKLALPFGGFRLDVRKQIAISSDSGLIELSWRIANAEDRELDAFFASEFNLTVLGPGDPAVGLRTDSGAVMGLSEAMLLSDIDWLTVFNRRDGWRLEFAFGGKPNSVAQYPVRTLSQSEGGVDRTYQATCIMPAWPLNLSPGGVAEFSLDLTLSAE